MKNEAGASIGVPAGVLVIDKPSGPTSHDMVSLARRVLGERRIGHCGTLDPMATGVLVLAVGSATRLARYLTSDEKQYDAVVRFGIETDTYDMTGEVRRESDARPTREAVDEALSRFRGIIQQTPPPFSAKKVDGQRAYALARRQAVVDLAPVAVDVRALTLTALDGATAHLTMTVSAGFYVRSLVHDLGTVLGMGAALEGLRRTASGDFTLARAVSSEELATRGRESIVARMVPIDALLPDRPSVHLSEAEVTSVRHGRDVKAHGVDSSRGAAAEEAEQNLVRLLGPDGGLVALGVPGKEAGFLHPSVVLR